MCAPRLPPDDEGPAEAPAGQKEPDSHGSQAVWPKLPVNLPGSQRVHASAFEAEANEPGRQIFGSAEPTEHDVPAGQTMQSLVRLLR